MYYCGRLLPKTVKKVKISVLITPFNVILEGLDNTVKQKEIKVFSMKKISRNLQLKVLVELITQFSKVSGCKINIQKSTVFPHTINEKHNLLNFYWNIVDFQCCVSFSCIAKVLGFSNTDHYRVLKRYTCAIHVRACLILCDLHVL